MKHPRQHMLSSFPSIFSYTILSMQTRPMCFGSQECFQSVSGHPMGIQVLSNLQMRRREEQMTTNEPWDPLADLLQELPQLTCKHRTAHNSRLTLFKLSRFNFTTPLMSYRNKKAYSKHSFSLYKDNSQLEETSIIETNFFATLY